MSVHDLVHLSCDYPLNTNKQKIEHGVSGRLPLTCSLCSSCPLGGNHGIPLLMFTLLPKEQAHVTIVIATKFYSVLHLRWFIFRYRFMQCFQRREELVYWSRVFVWQISPRGCYAGCYAVSLEHVERGAAEAASLSQRTQTRERTAKTQHQDDI